MNLLDSFVSCCIAEGIGMLDWRNLGWMERQGQTLPQVALYSRVALTRILAQSSEQTLLQGSIQVERRSENRFLM